VALGHWQAGRAAEKRALAARLEQALRSPPIEIGAAPLDPQALLWQRVAARGTWNEKYTVYLDNKLRRGRPGYEVVTPLRIDGVHVLVNRGWVEAGRSREVLPQVATPGGEVSVDGLALPRLPHVLEAGIAAPGKVRQNIELEAFQRESGLKLQPIVIEQHSPSPDGLVREWPRPDAGIEKHQSYSLQWYSLAILSIVLFFALSFRRVRAR